MKAYSCCSGGVMFVPEAIERGTNKSQSKSYEDVVGEDVEAMPLREKIFGVFFKENKKAKSA